MAEENKMQFKAVEVSMDDEGNQVITPVEKPTAEPTAEEAEAAKVAAALEADAAAAAEGGNEEEEEEELSDAEKQAAIDAQAAADAAAGGESEEEEEEEEEEENVQTNNDEVVDYDELPESVQGYLDFLEETGGSMQDYLAANRDFSKMPQDEAIRAHLKATNPYLDDDDIQYEMETRFGIDEDLDSEKEIRDKKIAKKKFHGEAVRSLTEVNAKYKVDLESSSAIPQKAQEAIKFQEQFNADRASKAKANAVVRSSFEKETNKLLGKDFKGFEVNIDGVSQTYKPQDVSKTKEHNLDVNNLLGKFTDKNGSVTDVEGYHKALTFASNPDAIAKHFYDLGKAAMVEEDVKDSKNIQMKPRQVQQSKDNSKTKFKFVDLENSGKKGKINLRNY